MAALFVGVTEVMKNHHYNHKNSVSNGEDVEGRPPYVFCLDVELQVALEKWTNQNRREIEINKRSPGAWICDDGDAETGQ